MKRCPRCHQTYTDETLKFCRDDGTLLQADSSPFTEPPDTWLLPKARASDVLTTKLPQGEPVRTEGGTSRIDPAQGTKAGGAGEIKWSQRRVAVVVSVLILAIGGLSYWLFKSRSASDSSHRAPIESIAVLPFVNASGNADVEYLSDGMAESLINSLSRLPKLSVKARSSVFRYKGKEIEPQQVGKELSVQAILNGRVLQRSNQLTLTLELVDARTGNQIWGEQYNRKLTDILTLQSEIASDVSNKLRQKLTGEDEQKVTKRYTENTEAYQLYLRGLYHWHKRTPDDLKQSLTLFQQAIDKDPTYAQAYGGLAMGYAVLDANTLLNEQETTESRLKAKAAALKALELDDNLAEAHAVLAEEKINEWDFAGAENDYKRAIELNPNFATARQWYSELLSRFERHDEAIAEIKRAYELDPFSRAINMNVALRYQAARRHDEAIPQFKKLIEMEPTYPQAYTFLAYSYIEKGMYEEAIDPLCKADVLWKIETAESCERRTTAFRQAVKTNGAIGFWRKLLEYESKNYQQGIGSAVAVAGCYARLGEKERAYEWLEKAYAKRTSDLTYLRIDQSFDNLRSDFSFRDLLRRIGLTA
jgi:TolB-like protein/Flp pilus assembly protein TadD